MSFYLLIVILSVAIQGLFAFFEMASVSFNKVRLQYYASVGKKRALWLNYLLKRPSRLFGTTLIGINTALFVGSEASRRVYESIGVDPAWAPLSQLFIVIIFGELVPMFAARRYPEQAALFCAPLMVVLARLFTPIIWLFDMFAQLIHRAMGKAKDVPLFLSRDEVKTAFREGSEEDEFSENIFQLKNLSAGQLMTPLDKVATISASTTLGEMRSHLSSQFFVPIYQRSPTHIVKIAVLRDLLRVNDNAKVIDYARSPWFVPKDLSVLKLLHQFRSNKQSIAVILDTTGRACGILTLDQILSEIFGAESTQPAPVEEAPDYIERTLSGEMTVAEFNAQFEAALPGVEGETLSDLIIANLGHAPVKGEIIRIEDFEFEVEEPTLRGVKTVTVKTIQE
jgi:CBS domain containing-hemolysin-like protein